MAKAAKDNDRLLVQWVIIMSYATFQFCYSGLEILPWEAKACLFSIKTLHEAQCEHITRTFFSPFWQGKKKKKNNNQEKETLLRNPHTTTPVKDMYIPHNSCFTNHSSCLSHFDPCRSHIVTLSILCHLWSLVFTRWFKVLVPHTLAVADVAQSRTVPLPPQVASCEASQQCPSQEGFVVASNNAL